MRVGRLVKAHGLKGALKVELYTDDPDRRFTPGATFTLQVPSESPWHGKSIELIELRWYNTHAVAFFKDVLDRTAAESLVKAILWVEQDTAEASVEEDAWFDYQLVGLEVVRDGVKVGTVSRIDHLPAQDLLTVKTDDGDVLVPFVKAIVPSVDIEAGTLTVTPPPGLFEQLPDDSPDDEDVAAGDDGDADTAGDAEIAEPTEPTAEPTDQ